MYVGSETCHYCEMYNEAINEFYEEYNTDIYYVNLYAASDEDRTKLYATNEYFQGGWGTPTSMIYYNGEVLEIISGYRDKDSLVEILENVYLKAFLIDNKVL